MPDKENSTSGKRSTNHSSDGSQNETQSSKSNHVKQADNKAFEKQKKSTAKNVKQNTNVDQE